MSDDGQYTDDTKLRSRGSLHERYASVGWFGWLASRLDLSAGASLLDVGCGPGWFWQNARSSLPPSLSLTLTDTSAGMVEAARRNIQPGPPFASVDFRQADASALPFADVIFDAVVAMHMLYHVPDPAAGLNEMARVLRPGGRIHLTLNDTGDLAALHDILDQVFGPSGSHAVRSLLTLDDAVSLLGPHFTDIRRQNLVQTYDIDDPAAAFDYLTSFPPGVNASSEERNALREAIATSLNPNGTLPAMRRSGLISARRSP